MYIITISGHAKNGKDTIANILKEKLESRNKKVLIIHFADYLKFVCEKYFGWDGKKDERGRTILQEVGTDIVRKRDQYFWVDIVCRLINVLSNDFDFFIIPDCRFENEIEYPESEYGLKIFATNIRRYENNIIFDNGLTLEQKRHPSETSLDYYEFDWTFINDSDINALYGKADEFIEYYNL